ncbi:hypothetical protein O181_011756 [Austropuccinia psidii MF-1]|uniref:Uncharacterized protein n=1 Tax=Austropuccinia psidii MF-1 TaxID=1389203 RepID=A0A9Q3BWC7_9BASI|nr:hypothetical protein [Austropuccinia psidii MF-1]
MFSNTGGNALRRIGMRLTLRAPIVYRLCTPPAMQYGSYRSMPAQRSVTKEAVKKLLLLFSAQQATSTREPCRRNTFSQSRRRPRAKIFYSLFGRQV